MNKRNLRSYVETTQRGYAYGLTDGTDRFAEGYTYDDGTQASIDRAYREASQHAASLLETSKRRPDLIRDWTPLPGFAAARKGA